MTPDKDLKVFDWKGNEVKAGMIIYFVQTKSGWLESSRIGVLMTDKDGKPSQVWEPEEKWLARKNKQVWELGKELIVQKDGNERLFVVVTAEGTGELEGYTFNSNKYLDKKDPFDIDPPTIAIKGISDKK